MATHFLSATEAGHGDYEALPRAHGEAAPWLLRHRLAASILAGFAVVGVCSVASWVPAWTTTANVKQSSVPVEEIGFLPFYFPHDKVATSMSTVDCSGHGEKSDGVPLDFAGVWWMDGIPTFERLFGAGQATWTEGEEGCKSAGIHAYTREERESGVLNDNFGDSVPCRGRLDFNIAAKGTWASVHGTMLFGFNVQFVCGGRNASFLEICKIGAVMYSGGPGLPGPTYWMVRANEHLWIRYSYAPSGNTFQYYLKQVVGCDGKPVEPYWHNFNSHGKDVPQKEKDVFGHGGDERAHVADPGDYFWVNGR